LKEIKMRKGDYMSPDKQLLRSLLMVLLGTTSGLASGPLFFAERTAIDRVAGVAAVNSGLRQSALDVLERIAEGGTVAASQELASAAGLTTGEFGQPTYRRDEVRSHALRTIGELDLPETATYLQTLNTSALGSDRSGQLRSALAIARKQSELNAIRDEFGKIRLLEQTAAEHSPLGLWATEELCDRGSGSSLATIRGSLSDKYYGPFANTEFGFCEARIRLLSSSPDHVKALGSVLTVKANLDDEKLMTWAINQLNRIRSLAADAELKRFTGEIDAIPPDRMPIELRNARELILLLARSRVTGAK
jgi:hypothetical protein